MQKTAALTNQKIAAATIASATAQAMKDAANNAGGAAVGFYGLNAAQQAGGVNLNAMYAQTAAQPAPAAPAADSWTCPKCGAVNTGKFCGECGTAKPASGKWICPKCGKENEGKFCGECGTAKPE